MARSSVIYVACDKDGNVLVTCTVKHEMKSNLQKNNLLPLCHEIRAYRDNGNAEYRVIDIS